MEREYEREVISELVRRTRISFPQPDWLAVERGGLLADGAELGSIASIRVRRKNLARWFPRLGCGRIRVPFTKLTAAQRLDRMR